MWPLFFCRSLNTTAIGVYRGILHYGLSEAIRSVAAFSRHGRAITDTDGPERPFTESLSLQRSFPKRSSTTSCGMNTQAEVLREDPIKARWHLFAPKSDETGIAVGRPIIRFELFSPVQCRERPNRSRIQTPQASASRSYHRPGRSYRARTAATRQHQDACGPCSGRNKRCLRAAPRGLRPLATSSRTRHDASLEKRMSCRAGHGA